jgi:hypothetical protein
MTTASCRCGTTWRQVGNRTGHCANCHRTFSGITTFDAHQHMRDGQSTCLDPATLTTKNTGEPRFKTFTDPAGATVWRSAADRPDGTYEPDPRPAESATTPGTP